MRCDSVSTITNVTSKGPVPDYPAGSKEALALLMVLTTLIFYLLLFSTPAADAWGSDGHEIIANIAYHRLSHQARTSVNKILNGNHYFIGKKRDQKRIKMSATNTPLGEIATWADRVRYTKEWHWSAPLHFIDIEDQTYEGGCHFENKLNNVQSKDVCQFIYERDCKDDFCVAGAIANYTNILEKKTMFPSHHIEIKTREHRFLRGLNRITVWGNVNNISNIVKESLMFVTHFIGDIHQPLHCARKSDIGGNRILVNFEVASEKSHHWNLHSVWDTGIILRSIEEIYGNSRDNFEMYIQKLIETDYFVESATWLECGDGRRKVCTSEWGQESLVDALQYAYRSENGSELISNSNITTEYFKSRLVIIQKRLAIAGVRLASTIELILGNIDHVISL